MSFLSADAIVNISDVLDAIEDKVQAKTIARVSGEDRKTKGIVYEASGGRLFGLDLDQLHAAMKKDSITARYVNTKQQIADMFTKASFTADQWSNLQ